jgi:hypothetical protein
LALSYQIFTDSDSLPETWDGVASYNLFLTKSYFRVLQESAPANMSCFFIGLFDEDKLVGCAIAQFLDMASVDSFGSRDHCLKENLRLFFFRRFASRVLILGNNMLSGENTFVFKSDIDQSDAFTALEGAMDSLRKDLAKQGRAPHLVVWKDFKPELASMIPDSVRQKFFRFTAQPNMVFEIPADWISENNYVNTLNKKYRDQYKRARKKQHGVFMRQLSAKEISENLITIHALYRTVADNAPFNTFYLKPNHWLSLKDNLGEDFLLYGYFEGNKLVGFDTLIKNGSVMETYFLGYDASVQKQRMLYLNMLYNMLGYAVKNRFRKVIFGRTALEIKSSVGATPIELTSFMQHQNPIVHKFLPMLYGYFEPAVEWKQRHPFKHD